VISAAWAAEISVTAEAAATMNRLNVVFITLPI
jgi:hypothetical protein